MENAKKYIVNLIVISIIVIIISTLIKHKFENNRRYPEEGIEVITIEELSEDIKFMIEDLKAGSSIILNREESKYVVIKSYHGTLISLESIFRDDKKNMIDIKYNSMFIDETCDPTFLILRIDDFKGKVIVSDT